MFSESKLCSKLLLLVQKQMFQGLFLSQFNTIKVFSTKWHNQSNHPKQKQKIKNASNEKQVSHKPVQRSNHIMWPAGRHVTSAPRISNDYQLDVHWLPDTRELAAYTERMQNCESVDYICHGNTAAGRWVFQPKLYAHRRTCLTPVWAL